ncbi:54S ribosomal protein L32, mitochondrial, partial [Cichlidogyrus casuarinus]
MMRIISALIERISRIFPPFELNLVPAQVGLINPGRQTRTVFDINSLINNVYFAVPKHRKSLLARRVDFFRPCKSYSCLVNIGSDKQSQIEEVKNLTNCLNCGSYHPRDSICIHCYEKVRSETEILKAQLSNPVTNKEIQFVYQNDPTLKQEFQQNKKFIT